MVPMNSQGKLAWATGVTRAIGADVAPTAKSSDVKPAAVAAVASSPWSRRATVALKTKKEGREVTRGVGRA